MKLLADLHTHTKNSRFGHGKNTVEEMAISANEMGLVEVGITDHGYANFFRTTKQKLKQARKTINEINSWSKTKVLLGIEADIMREDGTIDIDTETLSMLDILIVSYHRMTFTDFAGFFGNVKKTEEARRKCTNAFINAIKKYPVTIVAHLDSVLTTDLYEIGKVCRERGTMVEINNRHTKWTEKQMNALIDSGCMFVVSSDAHSRDKVGDVDRAMEYIKKYNIPSERVANVEFEEEEKSEFDRSYSAYRSVYEQVAKARKEREEAIEVKRNTEITGSLSDEMEKALKDIAKQKGLHYEEHKPEVAEEVYMKSDDVGESDALILRAEEYLRNLALQEVEQENEQVVVEEEKEEVYSFDDDHPLLKDAFADKFQAINKVIKRNEKEEDSVSVPQEELVSNKINSEVPAYKQLEESNNSANIKNLKNLMNDNGANEDSEEKAENATQVVVGSIPRKVAPENFMDSITQTKLASGAKAAPKQEEKPSPIRKNAPKGVKRGAFIAVDNLIDGNSD